MNDGQHRSNTAHPQNGQRSSRGNNQVGQPAATPGSTRIGQLSGGEMQQGRRVPTTSPSADTIINGTGDSSEGGYGSQYPDDD